MTIANLIARGTASRVDFVLIIEGWPDIWVTNPRITMSAQASGRNVYHGLLHDGLQIQERTLPGEGRLEGDGITFRIVSTNASDEATASFCNYPEPIAKLETGLTLSTTTLDLVGSTTLSDGYYYVGTETIRVNTFPTIVRAEHSSVAQQHLVTESVPGIDEVRSVWLYSRPPAIEGRRAFLYMLTDDDAVTGITASQLVFRGYIRQPPRLSSDGLTWEVRADHITALLSQSVAPAEAIIKPIGIYHSKSCAVGMQIEYNGVTSSQGWLTGWLADPEALAASIRTELAVLIGEIASSDSTINDHTLSFVFDADANLYTITLATDATPPDGYTVWVHSALIGFPPSIEYRWIDSATGLPQSPVSLVGSTKYHRPLNSFLPDFLVKHAMFPEATLLDQPAYPGLCLGQVPYQRSHDAGPFDLLLHNPASTHAADRIYIDRNLSSLVGVAIQIPGITTSRLGAPRSGEYFLITAASSDSNGYYIEVDLSSFPVSGFITGQTEMRPVISYGEGDLSDFAAGLVALGGLANTGLVPHFVATDFGSFVVADSARLADRSYRFVASKTIEEVLAAEALLFGVMLYTDASESIAAKPLPVVTPGAIATLTIDTSDIITPYASHGTWPSATIQRDGLVNQISIQEGYDPITDDWAGIRFVVRDTSSISEHKSGGKGDREIKPYSLSRGNALDSDDATAIAVRYLRFMSRPYVAITIKVGWSCFGLRLGDVVNLTCSQVPNGQGSRGFTNKRCFVVERRWNLDPASGDDPGELVLWALLQDVAGYAPNARVTGKVDNGGDEWTLTCDSAHEVNIAMSTNGDGAALANFAVGDFVRVFELNESAGSVQTGQVVSIDLDNDEITVQFDGSILSEAAYILGFQDAASISRTQNMRRYSFVADNDLLIDSATDAEVADRFA